MASSSSASLRQPKHQVFLSFRGEDTRNSFLHHLYEAFRRKGVGAYADFKELPRGQQISHALLKAIEESMISIIVFSQNYATSSWCLEELSKIMECRDSLGQLVVPIFFHVNPFDIRNQTGSFGNAFVEHERSKADKVQRWRLALTQAGNLSGFNLTGDKPEPIVIEEIVHDVLNKLNQLSKSDYKGIIGIGPRIEQIKSLLCISGEDVRIIGIWGMGGIGKTTLAQAIYDEVSGQFESCYFLANVREEIERHGAIALRDKLLSKLLNEENLHIGTPRIGSAIIKDRLLQKRVLVVLDDVNDLEQLEILAISHDHIGSGSRIIVTSRDKQVLVNGSLGGIYELKELSYNDSLQLFSLFAFKQNHFLDDFKDLSNSFLGYAKGIPIALKVLGSTLYKKDIEYWESVLNGLKKYPNPKIQKVLKISFDGLPKVEKNIFLDIACFFKGYDKDDVTKILVGCYGCIAHCGITNLIDKCLLTVSKLNELGMHDLIQEMGRNVGSEERSRLWTPKVVCQLLENDWGTKSIKGILLDQSKMVKVQLHPRAFARMRNLRIIKFYGMGCKWALSNKGLKSLPEELRYFHWDNCVLKSLPSNFSPVNLVELRLQGSNVEQLWNGKQNLVNLRMLDLQFCNYLTRIPDLSTSINLQILLITGCKSLVELPSMIHLKSLECSQEVHDCDNLKKFPELPQHITSLTIWTTAINEIPKSISNLESLESLNLSACLIVQFPEVPRNLKRLNLIGNQIKEVPSSIGCLNQLSHLNMEGNQIHNLPTTILQLDALQSICLCDCPNITKFPNVPERIKRLALDNTPIEEVPSSISRLKSLTCLTMRGCTKLKSLPPSICELKSLEELNLHGCSNLEYFPDILKTMECLIRLDLDVTAIEEVPSSISRLKSLKRLSMWRCTKLKSLPTSLCELKSLGVLNLNDCSNLEYFPEISKTMEGLNYLYLSGTAIKVLLPSNILGLGDCRNLSVPSSFCNLVFLRELHLSGSNIVEIHESIKQLSMLHSLILRFCKCLQSLPELPPCLRFLDAEGCTSLERVAKGEQFQYMSIPIHAYHQCFNWFIFYNCINLDQNAVNNIVANAQLKIQCMAKLFAVDSYEGDYHGFDKGVICCFPGSEISETFKNRSINSSITVQLSPACSNERFLGFVLCIVVDIDLCSHFRDLRVECKYRLKTRCGDHHNFAYSWYLLENMVVDTCFESNHVILLFDGFQSGIIEASTNKHFDEASFEFYVETTDSKRKKAHIKVQKCGVNVFYVDDVRSKGKEVEYNTNDRSYDEKAVDPTNKTLEASFHAYLSSTQDEEEEPNDRSPLSSILAFLLRCLCKA